MALTSLVPIDHLVVEFPAGESSFSGEMGNQLKLLVEEGVVRVLVLLFIKRMRMAPLESFEMHEYDDDDAGVLASLAQRPA